MSITWLRRDGRNRSWRTILQGIVALFLIPGLTAGIEVLRTGLLAGAGGVAVDWPALFQRAEYVAVDAMVIAFLAYLHRAKVDPSRLPSAAPPLPPGIPPANLAPGARR